MSELLPYIPTDRRHALARGEDLPDRAVGSALFVDISGFTPLAEALALDLGPQRGAEELTSYLNLVYDALIAELDRYRGSVIGFSGDAVTCWFDGDIGLTATACALEMHKAMDQFSSIALATGEKIPLRVKAGVAAGKARRFLVGDPERQLLDVLAGSLLDEMAEAEHHAEQGNVVLGPSAIQALGDQAKFSSHQHTASGSFGVLSELGVLVNPDPWPEVPTKSLTEEKLRPWLLAPVYERLQAGQGEFLAELRPAVAEFVRFEGIDYDEDGSAGEKLDDFVRRVQRILISYDGTLVDITTGDKGSHLYLAFGAPVAHEDDVERAAALALEVRSEAESLDYITSLQIGINRGRMRTGAYGGRTRRTYGVLGDATNLAARLMMAAEPGEVLASKAISDKAELSFNWKTHPAIKVKGKTDPISVFTLVDRSDQRLQDRPAREHLLPMVGREEEMAIIQEKVELALGGQGQIVGITAEAGMGKSRLMAESVRAARAQRMSTYRGECKSYGTHTSYMVWSTIWRDIFQLDTTQSSDAQLSSLQDQVERMNKSLLPRVPLLGPLLNFHIPDSDFTSQFEAKLRKTSLEAMLAELLNVHSGETPLVLVLEDTHWIDPLSMDLLDVLARAIEELPVLLLLVYRPAEETTKEPTRVSKLSHFTEIELTHLTQEQAEQWISIKASQLYGHEESPPAEFTRRLIERADGNPFYIEETLNYLKDNELSLGEVDSLAQINLPASLNSLVLTRIDQLSERPRTTLRVASVFGRSFNAPFLTGAHPDTADDNRIAKELAELDRKGFVEVESEVEESYLFKHSVIQEVAYESLPFGTRHGLHRKIGEFIEATFEDSPEEQIDLLAYHFFSGEAWSKALDYKLEAARQAQGKYANDDAIGAAQDALTAGEQSEVEYSETSAKILSVHELLGEVLAVVGRYDEALANLGSARELAEANPASSMLARRMAELCRKTADVYERQSEYEIAHEWLELGLQRLDQTAPTIEAVRILLLKAGVHYRQGKFEETITLGGEILLRASRIQSREAKQAVAQTYYLMGGTNIRLGDLEQAAELSGKSVRAYEEIDHIVGQAKAYNNLGNAYTSLGKWDLASEALEKSLGIFQKIGDIQEQGFVRNNLGNIYLNRGEWDRAAELFQQSNSVWKQIGAALPDAVTLSNLAQVHIYREEAPAAVECLRASQEIFTRVGSEAFVPELERRFGEYHLFCGEMDDAFDHINRSIDHAREQDARLEIGMSLRLLGEIFILRGDLESGKDALLESLRTLNELKSEYEAAKTVLALGQLALEGEVAIDRTQIDQAISTLERLGAEADLVRGRELAQLMSSEGM